MGLRGGVVGIGVRVFGGKEGRAMWSWLNGKKTAIGLTCVALGTVLTSLVPVIEPTLAAWGVSAATIASVVHGVGWLITGVGSAHRVVKEL